MDLEAGGYGGGGAEGGATWNPSPSAVTRAADLGGGGHYTTKGRPSGSRDPDAARWGASRASDFYRGPRDGGPDRQKDVGSPVDMLVDTVARMQLDLADLRAENRMLRTPGVPQVVRAPRQAAFTTTKVPRFDGTTSWEQYKQVFDAIVRLNGWDNDTAALQLFSHLEGGCIERGSSSATLTSVI